MAETGMICREYPDFTYNPYTPTTSDIHVKSIVCFMGGYDGQLRLRIRCCAIVNTKISLNSGP